MSAIVETANFQGHALPIHAHANDHWITGVDIGNALEYPDPANAISSLFRRHKEELEEYTSSVKLTDQVQARTVRAFNEEGVMIITMLSRQPKAAEFRRWAVRVLKAYRHGALLPATAPRPGQVEALALSRRAEALDRAAAVIGTELLKLDPARKKLMRYQKRDLTIPEIATLMGWGKDKVRRELKLLEACGKIQPSERTLKQRANGLRNLAIAHQRA